MNRIKISSFQTVYGENFEEVTLKDFFAKLEKNIESNDYNVNYDEKTNRFIITYAGTSYILELDEKTANNYILGIYNDITLLLRKLANLEDKVTKKNDNIKKYNEQKEIILKNALENNSLPDDNAKMIFLEYLKKSKRFSFKKIKDYFINFKSDISKSYNSTRIIRKHIWPFNGDVISTLENIILASLIQTTLATVICLFVKIHAGLEEANRFLLPSMGVGAATPYLIYIIPVGVFLKEQVKNRFQRLINSIKKKKITNRKIKQLTKELKNSSLDSSNIEYSEGKNNNLSQVEAYEYSDTIYTEINNLANKLIYINVKDRAPIIRELKDILDEYNNRVKKINENSSSEKIELDKDDMIKLKMDIISKISILENKINSLIQENIELNSRAKDQEKIERVLETVADYNDYSDDIDFDSGTATKKR